MKVIAYCRVSTTKQDDEGVSLDMQRERLINYCQALDLELVDIVQEAASAKSIKKRPIFCDVRERLIAGEADALLVFKLDRLTRSVRDLSTLLEEDIKPKRYTLISVNESIDTESAVGRMFISIIITIAQWEREAIAERTTAALRHKLSKGEKIGGDCPYGFQVVVESGVKHLEPCEYEQDNISTMQRLRSEQFSYYKIAKRLNEFGIKNRAGGTWQTGQIKRILTRAEEIPAALL